MNDLARYFGIKPPSVTSIINRLVEDGYLKREADKKDRRITHLNLTTLGKRRLHGGLKDMNERVKKLLILLSEQDRRNMINILEKVTKAYHH